MVKKYHCDYCDKTMVATPAIVKTHNSGIVHQKMVRAHYDQYKDPEEILAEEAYKRPCNKFAKGECSFGSICRYSHYTREQLKAFQDFIDDKIKMQTATKEAPPFQELYKKLQNRKSLKMQESGNINTTLYDSSGVMYVLPWTYNRIFDRHGENLPPSIKRLKVEDFVDATITTWG